VAEVTLGKYQERGFDCELVVSPLLKFEPENIEFIETALRISQLDIS
jgi:hypothetical protein